MINKKNPSYKEQKSDPMVNKKGNPRLVCFYFNAEHDLIAIPFVDGGNIDYVDVLDSPYDISTLESFVAGILGKNFFSYPSLGWPPRRCILSEYLGFKTWWRTILGRGAVSVSRTIDRGYCIVPTKKEPKKGHGLTSLEEQKIDLPELFEPGQLAEAFLKAMAISEEAGI